MPDIYVGPPLALTRRELVSNTSSDMSTVDALNDQTHIRKFRRNGQLQSCEPCRKSKLGCDHRIPVCGRCTKKRRAEQCVYVSNLALLNQGVSRTPTATLTPPQRATDSSPRIPFVLSEEIPPAEETCGGTDAFPLPQSRPSVEPSASRTQPTPPVSILDSQSNCTNSRPHGFMGATSFSSILREGLNTLADSPSDLEKTNTNLASVSSERIARSCEVLSFLKHDDAIDRLLLQNDKFSACYMICPDFVMKKWLRGFLGHHSQALASQNPETMYQLCELLWSNTKSSMAIQRNSTISEWASLGTGPNIRWEVVGFIAVALGTCINILDKNDSLLGDFAHPEATVKQMIEISRTCIRFCQERDSLGDMFLWLLFEHARLVAAVHGGGSYQAYRAIGESNDALVAMGLHQASSKNDKIPFYLSEIRRRLLAKLYILEVGTATFLGRPPRLSSRYCTLTPPLDLLDNQIMQQEPELTASLATLDKNGFNTNGRLGLMVLLKTCLDFAKRREDILDLALRQMPREGILDSAASIKRQTEEQWGNFPPFIQSIRGPVDGYERLASPPDTLLRTMIRQEWQSNELLLQRVLIKKTGANRQQLIRTAQSMFNDILLIAQRYDIPALFEGDWISLLVVHGLRSSVILAVELLKQEQSQTVPDVMVLLPRSRTIQDLSVFAARLGAIHPSSGSFSMCDQGHRFITFILDKILNPRSIPNAQQQQSQSSATSPQGGEVWASSGTSMTDLDIVLDTSLEFGCDTDFSQLLESINWGESCTWACI